MVQERTGLYPGLGKIIAIGMWLIAEDRGLILLEGKSEETRDWSKVPNAKIFRGDEKAILEEFWRLVARTPKAGIPRLVSYNGRGYDGPMLTIRSAARRSPSRNLLGSRYSIAEHCDLMEIFSFMGATRGALARLLVPALRHREPQGLDRRLAGRARVPRGAHRRDRRVLPARRARDGAALPEDRTDDAPAVPGRGMRELWGNLLRVDLSRPSCANRVPWNPARQSVGSSKASPASPQGINPSSAHRTRFLKSRDHPGWTRPVRDCWSNSAALRFASSWAGSPASERVRARDGGRRSARRHRAANLRRLLDVLAGVRRRPCA